MRMRARIFIISIATLLFVILTGATAVPDALAENRNDSRRDGYDGRDARHQGGKLQQEIDALKLKLAAAAGAAVIQVDLGSKAMDDGSCFTGLIGFPGSHVVAATAVAFTPPYSVR